MIIYFLIPIYNEAENIPLLAQNLMSVIPNESKHYIFIDDCSKDNTVSIIKEKFENLKYTIISKTQNQGPGDSFNIGFNWIIENSQNNDDIIVTIEADNTSDLSILPTMILLSKSNYSLVLASVYAQGGGFDQTSFFRKIISFFANMLFRLFFDIKVLTLSSFYRVYHINLIKTIKEHNNKIISEKGFICMLEILLKAIKINAKIIEVPMVLYSSNRKGKSKMKIWKTIRGYLLFILFKSKK